MSDRTDKIADTIGDINTIVSSLVPMIGPVLGLVQLVVKLVEKPDLDPAVRTAAIAALRANAALLGDNASGWLAAHGYDADGQKTPLP